MDKFPDRVNSLIPRFDLAKTPGSQLFDRLIKEVEKAATRAPENQDVLVRAFDVLVDKFLFLDPDTFVLSGTDYAGNHTRVVLHYSQLVAHIVFLDRDPEIPERRITGFGVAN